MINTYALDGLKLFKRKLTWFLLLIIMLVVPLPLGVMSSGSLISLNERTSHQLLNSYYMVGVNVYENVNMIFLVASLFNVERDIFIPERSRSKDLSYEGSIHIAKYVALSNQNYILKDNGAQHFVLTKKPDESGPSGGLAMTLCLLEMIREINYQGLRIVATGEINAWGEVLPIGGIKYKTLAVNKSNVDIFLVPGQNYQEARSYFDNDNIKLVKVRSLEDALRYLVNLSKH